MSCLPIVPVLKAFIKVMIVNWMWMSLKLRFLSGALLKHKSYLKRKLYHTLISVTEGSGSVGTFVYQGVKRRGGGREMKATNGSVWPHKCNVAFSLVSIISPQ